MFTKPSVITRTQITVTPEKAREWLGKNTHNRPKNEAAIAFYAKQISAGEWQYNGDAIKFDWNDVLLDGQHRLYAIIKAERSIVCDVVRGLDPNVFTTLDTGRKRTGANALSMLGYTNTNNLAAALRWQYKYEHNSWNEGRGFNLRLSNTELVKMAEQHPNMIDALHTAASLCHILQPSCGAFLAYQFIQRDEELCRGFFEGLQTGSQLASNNPVLVFRNKLLLARGRATLLKPLWTIAYGIKAWNALRRNEPMTYLTWRNTPQRADESMPEIL